MLNGILYSLNSMMANPILTLAAVVPAIVLMILVFKTDKLNKEPIGLLLSLIVLGILSTQLAALAENIGGTVLGLFWDKNSLIFRLLFYFIVVGGSEELAKYILLRWRTWRHKAFDCQFDGAVYAVFIFLGFATWILDISN